SQMRFILSLKYLFDHQIMAQEMGATASATTTVCQSSQQTITTMPASVRVDVKRRRKWPQISGLIQLVSWVTWYRDVPIVGPSWYLKDSGRRCRNMSVWKLSVMLSLTRVLR